MDSRGSTPELMNNSFSKIRSRKGSSLAETLAAILILSLALSVVAGSATTIQRVYKHVRLKANAQTLASTTINAIAGKLYHSNVYSFTDTEEPTPLHATGEEGICYTQSDTPPADQEQATQTSGTVDTIYCEEEGYLHFANNEGGKETDKVYPIVTDKTQSLDLYAKLENNAITYNNGCYTFTVQIGYDETSTDPKTFHLVTSQKACIRSEIALQN